MPQYFKNFTAAARRSSMKYFGLASASQDLSYIASPDDISVADLTGQVNSAATAFTLPVTASFVEELLWNGRSVYADTLSPGFTMNAAGTIVTTNFVPLYGDTLVARYWPA